MSEREKALEKFQRVVARTREEKGFTDAQVDALLEEQARKGSGLALSTLRQLHELYAIGEPTDRFWADALVRKFDDDRPVAPFEPNVQPNSGRRICGNCGGDGGAAGGCFKCDGTGWEE